MSAVRAAVTIQPLVVTVARSSCGWMNWMKMYSRPARAVERPAARIRLAGVTVIGVNL